MLKPKMVLEDKYALDSTRAYMTGIEALVRLPILQHQRDLNAGLNTAGFISGYRGSPVGSVDQSMWKAQQYLDKHNIVFQPGVNEDLAATAVWGSQQVNLYEGAKYDGVFAMWYGKGPGVDRSMDVIKHANAFGTSKYGGVLAVAGDDHACKSSTLPHKSEHMFIGASVPVLSPANVQEVLDLGIFGWELSRYSGCWVALKAITENMDSAISADIDPNRIKIIIPEDFEMPEEGVHGRWPSTPLEQERTLNKFRIYAARKFARVNNLNKVMFDSLKPRLGIITAGKSYLDVLQAFDDLGIDEKKAAEIGLRVFKLGMTWPLEPEATHEFASGLEEILVVEEKRSVIEDQLTGQLYNWSVAERPAVVGEFDQLGNDLLSNLGELTPAMVARAIASRIATFYEDDAIRQRLAFLDAKEIALARPRCRLERRPFFCSGCPHNTSTKVPEGSRAMAGIGCHYMVGWMDRETYTFTQMGGEGANWIGQAPFTKTQHVFQNMGDGTYFHSGLLAIRAALAAPVNITYKILYNDAVAMTGGQPLDGELSIDMIVSQLRGEGVKRIALVSDDPNKYPQQYKKTDGLTIDHRDELDRIQREFRELVGTTVIIYDQTCAAEKRRKRKKGLLENPPARIFINEDVCEGCGDCGVQSNCLSVLPKETALGRKRVIDQSACNKDYSCVKGFCPSFVTVNGGKLRKNTIDDQSVIFDPLPEPLQPSLRQPWNVLVTGIGGTGVLTISSILAMAAHIEGKGCSTLNQTGLAQKFGAVVSHLRISHRQEDIHAVRIAAGDADLMLGCDLIVSDSDEALAKLHLKRSNVVINDYESSTADFIQNPDIEFPTAAMKQTIVDEVGEEKAAFINATEIASVLLGDPIGSNLFLAGYAYQKGLIPVSANAIEQAIELNNVAVDFNRQAFLWGRRAAHNLASVKKAANIDIHLDSPFAANTHGTVKTLDESIAWRTHFLVKYQDQSYADQYARFVQRVRVRDTEVSANGDCDLTQAVANNLHKLMAYKDEYEVARLYSDGVFMKKLREQFEGEFTFKIHLAPPLFSKKDRVTGHLIKREYPQWTLKVFALLATLKGLRGTPWDIFGYSIERKNERAIIENYKRTIDKLLHDLTAENYEKAVEIASLPMLIRGYGHIKDASIEKVAVQEEALLKQFCSVETQVVKFFTASK